MSKERARRREERERAVAAAAAERAAEAERQARREARRSSLTRWLPRTSSGQSGTLAARKRQQKGLVVAFVVAVNVLVWLGTDAWPLRALVLLLSVLVTPIVASLVSRK